MRETRPIIDQTVDAAAFAFREYFRPLAVVVRYFRSLLSSPETAQPVPEDQWSLEEARSILRERLAKGRRHEKILLMQGVIAALASLLALSISLMHALGVELAVIVAILLPASVFTVWVVLRLVQTREEIVQLKTIRWVIRSLDEDTGNRVVKQLLWGKPKPNKQSTKVKDTSDSQDATR